MQNIAQEILINARQVTRDGLGDSYEFILNNQLQVLECVRIESLERAIIRPVYEIDHALDGMLLELNHVRVNPRLDNSEIIEILTKALNKIGVRVSNSGQSDSMAICFKPLGEISDNVRFYLKSGSVVFLSPAMRPKVIRSNKI